MVIYIKDNSVNATKDIRAPKKSIASAPFGMMQFGMISNSAKTLFPVTNQTRSELFNKARLHEYAQGHVRETPDKYTRIEYTSSENASSMAKDYGEMYSAEASAGLWGVAVSGSIKKDFHINTESEVTSKISQAKIYARQFTVALPASILRNQLRGLLNDNVRDKIDSVDSLDAAKKVVEGLGAVYMQKSFFGGVMTISTHSTSSSYKTSAELEEALKAEVTYMTNTASAGVSFKQGTNEAHTSKDLWYNVEALGGSTTAALSGDTDAWAKSLEEESAALTVVGFELEPISNLAEEGSDAERFLVDAVKQYCHDTLVRLGMFPGEGAYTMHFDYPPPVHVIGFPKTMSASKKFLVPNKQRYAIFESGDRVIPTEWKVVPAGQDDVYKLYAKIEGDNDLWGIRLRDDNNGRHSIVLEKNLEEDYVVEWTISPGSAFRFLLETKGSRDVPRGLHLSIDTARLDAYASHINGPKYSEFEFAN